MENLPLELGDMVAVTISGLKLVVLAKGLKHAEARAFPEGENLATATMILPSAGPNDPGMLMVCGPSQVVNTGDAVSRSGFTGPELCLDVNLVEDHIPQKR